MHRYLLVTYDLLTCPLNWILVAICFGLIILIKKRKSSSGPPVKLENLKQRDFTPEELSRYNGLNGEGRVLVAVNRYVFDVTNNGYDTYGPDGPYSSCAGRDASRALACFSVDKVNTSSYDDLSSLSKAEIERLAEWERQFRERYPIVGKLLAPGETHHIYEDSIQGVDSNKKKED